ncbi:MAG TPA: hypothetical protein ACQGQJ_00695 [Xylella fastidiosa subsp. multiplex]
MNNSKLLNELRIEQDQSANDCRGKGRWMAIVVSIAVIHLMVAVVWCGGVPRGLFWCSA